MTRKLVSLVAAFGLAVGMLAGLTSSTSASHGIPHTFTGCVLAGGTVTVSGFLGSTSKCTLSVDGVTYEFESEHSNAGFEIGVEETTTVNTQVFRPDLTKETTTYGDVVSCENRGGNQIGGSNGNSKAMEKNKNCQPTIQ
jgi:hypothetical protein